MGKTKQPDGHYTRLSERHVWAFLHTRRSTVPFTQVEGLEMAYNAFGVIPYSVINPQSPQQGKREAQDLALQIAKKLRKGAKLDPLEQSSLRVALVLRRSSEWYARGLHTAHSNISYLIVGMHDSCIPFSVYAMDCMRQFAARETFYSFAAPEFLQQRCSGFGHQILLGGLVCGVQAAQSILEQLPSSTQARVRKEVSELADRRYRSRLPLRGSHLRLTQRKEA